MAIECNNAMEMIYVLKQVLCRGTGVSEHMKNKQFKWEDCCSETLMKM